MYFGGQVSKYTYLLKMLNLLRAKHAWFKKSFFQLPEQYTLI